MEEKEDYSHDTGAMRRVAAVELPAIAEDVKIARENMVLAQSMGTAILAHAFSTASGMWSEAASAIVDKMEAAEERINDSADALRASADDYDEADAQAAAEFTKILRSFDPQ
ncbi:hypothetical protein ABT324_15320 [Saccharopolyspora sp. NPDC000359]|uniref:hypothetical protein n=1 Tax=Saccharopolyspora sp. NPDC000359 TaxID=3154251 RepID=UPI00332F2D74